jgi:hypothetical protein
VRVPRRADLLALLALAVAGCAHIEPPSGGPEDRTAPRVLLTRPDTLAVVPSWNGAVTFVFSERMSEQRVEEAVTVSPRTSPVEVSHHGDEIRVDLRRGWQKGVIYHVVVGSIVQDLFNNRLTEPAELVFSTGPAIPDTYTTGLVIDRVTAKPDTSVRVEAIRRADSLVYAAPTDTAGRFVISRIPAGDYLVRAFRDVNRNRALDPFEASDTASATVAVGDTATVRLLSVVLPDTTPPRASSAMLAAANRVEVKFDDYLDPGQQIPAAQVTVLGPDSAAVAIAGVRVGAGAAPGDSAANNAAARPAAQQPPPAAVPPLVAAPAEAGPVGPVPSQTLSIDLAAGATLAPETRYRVRVRGARNVVGLTGDSEVEFTTPPAPKPTAPPAPAGGAR